MTTHGKGWHDDGDPTGPRGCLGVLAGIAATAILGCVVGMALIAIWAYAEGI